MICRRYVISGLVQGVFYRASTQEQAQSLGLKGWVKNLRDGCVEAVACGDAQQLERFESWLHQGPPMAQVDNIEIHDLPHEMFDDFSVRY